MPRIWEQRGTVSGITNMFKFDVSKVNTVDTGDKRLPPCRLCGQVQHIVDDSAYADVCACSTTGCPNNQDTRLKFDTNAQYTEHIENIGNKNRIWKRRYGRQVV